jgi:hypothetical protein
MGVSLTHDEFLERLLRRERLFKLALDYVCKRTPIKVKVSLDESLDNPRVDWDLLNNALADIVSKIITRVIDLVYNEDLT